MEIQVPVIKEVDVLLIGGTLTGCALALKLRRAARRVLLACEDSALGTDAGGRLDRERSQNEPLLENACGTPVETQAHLDEMMLTEGVEFLFDVIPLRPLIASGSHRLAGWFFFGRSGHFAIAAKAVVDATFDACLPYQMKLARQSTALAECVIKWNLIGNCAESTEKDGTKVEISLPLVEINGTTAPLCTCQKSFKLRQNDLPAKLDAATTLRAEACGNDFQHGANWCTFVFTTNPWEGISATELTPIFHAADPDMPLLLQRTLPTVKTPDSFLAVECRRSPLAEGETLLWKTRWPRPGKYPTVTLPLEALAVNSTAETDVLILGAGIAGVEAARSASSEGLRVLLLEGGGHVQAPLLELIRDGIRVWHHSSIAAVLMHGKSAVGAVVACATGETCLVRAKILIDATGYGIIASAAGAPMKQPFEAEAVIPGAVVAPRMPSNCLGTPNSLLYAENDTLDTTRAIIIRHLRQRKAFCADFSDGPRVRPRIISDLTLMPQDLLLQRRYKDSIALAQGELPSEATSCHPLLWLTKQCGTAARTWIPFRALLPLRLEGTIILGQAISAHKDVLHLCGHEDLLKAEGRAAARAAALSIKLGLPLRQIPIRKLQEILVNDGTLPSEALLSEDGLAAPEGTPLAAIFHRPDQKRRVLQAKYDQEQSLDTALVLAFLGDSSGRDLISSAISKISVTEMPRDFSILVEALSVIGGNSSALQEKLRTVTADAPLSVLRSFAIFFHRWPDKGAAPLLRKLLSHLLTGTLLRTGLSEALDAEDNNEEQRIKALYLAAALHECDRRDEDALETLNTFGKSWHLLIALLAQNTLRH